MYIFFNNPLHTKSEGANSDDWTKTEFGFCCLSHPEPPPSLPASPLVPSLSLGDVISGTSITFPATGFLCCCFSNRLTEIEFTRHTIHPFKMYSSVVFGLVTETCNYHHSSISEHCHPVFTINTFQKFFIPSSLTQKELESSSLPGRFCIHAIFLQ